jgi:hypothetical protein
MAINYTWKLTSLKKRNSGSLNGVVFQTYWQKTGTDENGNTGSFSGATPFDPAQVDPNNFTPFDQLTEETVLGWIQAIVTGSYEQHVNEQIQRQIDEKVNASEEIGSGKFPWDPEPTEQPAAPTVPPTTPPAAG